MSTSKSNELPDYARTVGASAGPYVARVHLGHLPDLETLAVAAKLVESTDLREPRGHPCSFTVTERGNILIVATFGFELAGGHGPALALLPDMHRLFIGAGEELFCYDLTEPRRLWSDHADTGLWGWEVVEDTVLMSAELELAAWDQAGGKLWSRFVEPPWSYTVTAGQLTLDVMGEISKFGLRVGPVRPG